jgi:hypothetical protein
MQFPEGNSIRIHTRDERSFESDTYEWGELGIMFDWKQYPGVTKRHLIPWSNISFLITDLRTDNA